jgi:hypothetical protein
MAVIQVCLGAYLVLFLLKKHKMEVLQLLAAFQN